MMAVDSKIHLVFPMAGKGSRFIEGGFETPKPLIQIYGKPMFFWAIQSIRKFVNLASLRIVVLEEHIINYKIDKIILDFYPEALITALPEVTKGAVMTCLKGIENIEDHKPVVFSDCDHYFSSAEFYNFCKITKHTDADGAILTFKSNSPNYSYIKRNSHGVVIGTVEKKVVSDDAICGCYYFSSKATFCLAAEAYISICTDKEYFMSGVYDCLINTGIVKTISMDFHVPCGTPDELDKAKISELYRCLI
jgi:NDP-sugar pyrophosphorylase family protein